MSLLKVPKCDAIRNKVTEIQISAFTSLLSDANLLKNKAFLKGRDAFVNIVNDPSPQTILAAMAEVVKQKDFPEMIIYVRTYYFDLMSKKEVEKLRKEWIRCIAANGSKATKAQYVAFFDIIEGVLRLTQNKAYMTDLVRTSKKGIKVMQENKGILRR